MQPGNSDLSPAGEDRSPHSPAATHGNGMERIMAVFAAAGMRNTRQRRLIAERLAGAGATAADFATEDLWRELQGEEPNLGRATVFRAVEILHREGMLDRVTFADGGHRYRLCGTEHHHHVTCVRCRRVVEVDICLPPTLLAAIADETGFAIEGHVLDLFGVCARCRTQAAAEG